MVKEAVQENKVFKKAIVVSANDAHVRQDRFNLRKLGVEVAETFPMGAMATAFLLSNACDLIIVDSEVEDMTALAFLQSVKHNHMLKHIPVVMVTVLGDRNTVLDAISGGCAGYVLRPYNNDTFERHVTTAMQLQRFDEIEMQQLDDARRMLESGHYEDAIEEFTEILEQQESAQKYYDMGCHYLVKQKWGKAIVSFQKAIRINDLYAEAYQGLAEAYKGKGDLSKSESYLKKAADIYAEFDRMERVKEVFVEILKLDDKALNPFNSLGVKLRKNGDYQGAIRAYQQAIGITPNDENIYFNMAKAFYFMNEFEPALDKVAMALALRNDFPEAAILYRTIKGEDWHPAKGPSSGTPRVDYGSIKDV